MTWTMMNFTTMKSSVVEVYLTDDTYIGHVKEILSPGANDVWVVQRHGLRDALIPLY